MSGGNGDDTLQGMDGSDTLNGGKGVDTADYSDQSASVIVALNRPNGVATADHRTYTDLLLSIENVIGGTGDDVIVGTDDRNLIQGSDSKDTIYGLGDNDTIVGGSGRDDLDGGEGLDTLDYRAHSGSLLIDLKQPFFVVRENGKAGDTIDGFERVLGGRGGDSIYGGDSEDDLCGNAGDDSLLGYLGRDLLAGGSGHDTLAGGSTPTPSSSPPSLRPTVTLSLTSALPRAT